MSVRPIRKKQAARLRKALNRTPLPRFINLIEWLEDHGYADTAGQARKIILAGRVRSESHKLGIKTYKSVDGENIPYVDAVVPASLQATLVIVD